MDFSNRKIRVQGQLIPVKTGNGSDFVNKDISSAMDRVAPLIAWWASVRGAAIQEAEQADAAYRQWRAKRVLEVLEKDPKLAEWKVKAVIEALPQFMSYKKALSLAKENVEVSSGMVRAAEKWANVLQSRGANLRAERRTQGMHTPDHDPDEENDDDEQKVSPDDDSDGHGVDEDDEDEVDFPPSWGGSGKPTESYDSKRERLRQKTAERKAKKAAAASKSKGSPEPPKSKKKAKRTKKPSCVVEL